MKQFEQQSILLNELSFLHQPNISVLKKLESSDSESQNQGYPLKVIVASNFLKRCSVPESCLLRKVYYTTFELC